MVNSRVAFSLLALSACAGSIGDPEGFSDPARAFQCDAWQDVHERIVKPSCATSGCHAKQQPAANLDLDSPDPMLRLLGAPSALCKDQTLVEPLPLAPGYFVAKLIADKPECGEKMPAGHALSVEDVTCIRRWLAESLTSDTTPEPPADTEEAAR